METPSAEKPSDHAEHVIFTPEWVPVVVTCAWSRDASASVNGSCMIAVLVSAWQCAKSSSTVIIQSAVTVTANSMIAASTGHSALTENSYVAFTVLLQSS